MKKIANISTIYIVLIYIYLHGTYFFNLLELGEFGWRGDSGCLSESTPPSKLNKMVSVQLDFMSGDLRFPCTRFTLLNRSKELTVLHSIKLSWCSYWFSMSEGRSATRWCLVTALLPIGFFTLFFVQFF